MNSSKHIVIVAHKYVTHPDDELVFFLNKKKYNNVLHIRHSFSDVPDRCSYYTWYKDGSVFQEDKTKDYSFLPEPLVYLKELYFTLKWVIATRQVWDVYIGMDGLCVLFGILLRSLKRVTRTIFWAIDFVPQNRFKEGIKNTIYHMINVFG